MKKFLLVVFIGMVLAINLYGITMEIVDVLTVKVEEDNPVGTVVYVE